MHFELSPLSYIEFSSFLHNKLGIKLGENKQYLVRSRLTAIAQNHNYTNINVFLKDVINGQNLALTNECLELMTTNETFWFRDTYPFTLLEEHLLPALLHRKRKVRIWSSACASGQEPYSIAMTIKSFICRNPKAFPNGIEIIASDFSETMIRAAQLAIYDGTALSRGLDDKYKDLYFEDTSSGDNNKSMQLNTEIRSMVKFKRHNLLNEFSSMGKFDIIFCRNVLIYFDGKQKIEILKKIAACLPQSGALMLGAAESINGTDNIYEMQTVDKGLYYSKL